MTEHELPADIGAALGPLFATLPLEEALTELVVTGPRSKALTDLARRIVEEPAIAAKPTLVAGIWLYVDELDRSHSVSQRIGDTTGSYWHGIMHRREGDFSNSRYWFRRIVGHPAIALVGDDYDWREFVDDVEAAHRCGEAPAALIALQRREWQTLFTWCARS